MPPARSRLQQTQHSTLPKLASRDTEMKTAVKVGCRKQPSSRLSTAIPTVASRSSLRPQGKTASSKHSCLSKGSTTQELVCNRTRELKESDESKEWLVAVGTALGAAKSDQTWDYAESSLSSKLAPDLPSGCKDAIPADQSAGDQLHRKLERVKKELEQMKRELADAIAQCEAYHQTLSSVEAQLRAAHVASQESV